LVSTKACPSNKRARFDFVTALEHTNTPELFRVSTGIGRGIIAVIAILACLAVAWTSAHIALSRLLAKYATIVNSVPAAQQAIVLTPADPEAHRALASALRHEDQLQAAAKENEIAVSLRPRDDLLWLDLGTIKDELDDSQGALLAFNESVRTAPFYGHPRWQRGNLLFRLGRYDEAFADLRQAANSNRALQPNLVDLAWAASKGDPRLTESILQIDNDRMRLSYARLLARKGRGVEAMEQLRLAGPVSDEVRNEMVLQLIGQKSFREAFLIWRNEAASNAGKQFVAEVFDGGFEGTLSLDEKAFGWRPARSGEQLTLSVDTTQKQSGNKSLLIQFNGNSDPAMSLVAQLVLVEPSRRYRLNFSTRTADLVTGGLPVVTITDGKTEQLLGKSTTVRQGTNEWEAQSIEFATGPDSSAVFVTLRRESCASSPCPVFGRIWLDSFSIESATPR